jgi:hypothetical protein
VVLLLQFLLFPHVLSKPKMLLQLQNVPLVMLHVPLVVLLKPLVVPLKLLAVPLKTLHVPLHVPLLSNFST